ncbi:hypothetical protein C7B81_11155 [Aphanothece cf. minutissima CCALA 015]|uniref:Uncharacterized protein n=1 Tax=Aphanothece cf. minutissima CCALA 015 TaxID=2107695 RepID=A0ABX5F631_9CHRO|nr:hypothetical protein C7B81_11155 [Aphanothece cf. minutissima CCALA 015]
MRDGPLQLGPQAAQPLRVVQMQQPLGDPPSQPPLILGGFHRGQPPHLQVQCWRRIPGGGSWNPRCGPMVLAVFIQRLLPGEIPV